MLYSLTQLQSDFRLEAEVDYQNGTQMTESELSTATALEIQYRYEYWDDTTATTGTWTCDGYFFESTTPVIYYEFSGADAVPNNARRLLGRAKITDANSRISYGKRFEIPIDPDELNF